MSLDRVVAALRQPDGLEALDPADWDLLVRQARSANLLARLAARLKARGAIDRVPDAVRPHMVSALTLARAQQDEARREVSHIVRALASLDVPIVLLKGSAYLLGELPAALGRTFADVDILVPRDRLAEVEAALMLAGWATTHHSEYDQRYYRSWMHELPPLQHVRRQTILDVHHAILPDTARSRPSSRLLIDKAQSLDGHRGLWILAPTDLVLHSMAHLFHNEDLSHGLRDLSDLDLLLRSFGSRPGFWEELVDRSNELDLSRSLHYGLEQAHAILATPVPESTLARARRFAPSWPVRGVMAALWSRALRSPHRSARDRWTPAALFALYVRAHWLRMPPLMLARHLFVKATTRRE